MPDPVAVLAAVAAEATTFDHLLWGAAIGLSIRLVQWLRHHRRVRSAAR